MVNNKRGGGRSEGGQGRAGDGGWDGISGGGGRSEGWRKRPGRATQRPEKDDERATGLKQAAEV